MPDLGILDRGLGRCESRAARADPSRISLRRGRQNDVAGAQDDGERPELDRKLRREREHHEPGGQRGRHIPLRVRRPESADERDTAERGRVRLRLRRGRQHHHPDQERLSPAHLRLCLDRVEGPVGLLRRHRHHLRRHRQPEQLAGRHDLHLAGRAAIGEPTEGHHRGKLYLQQRRDTVDQNRERREDLLHLGWFSACLSEDRQ